MRKSTLIVLGLAFILLLFISEQKTYASVDHTQLESKNETAKTQLIRLANQKGEQSIEEDIAEETVEKYNQATADETDEKIQHSVKVDNQSAASTTSNNEKDIRSVEKSAPTFIIIDNIKYHINKEQQITYSEVYEGDKVKSIQQFYAGSTVDNAQKHIKYIFNLNNSGNISSAAKLDERTQAVTNQYQYYTPVYFGNQAKNIKYKFDISSSGYVTKATRYEKGTQRVITRYEYYGHTIYGSHGNRIKNTFNINEAGYISSSSKREQNTNQIINWYQYYPKTAYGKHSSNIRYQFNLDGSNHIIKAVELEKGSQRLVTSFKYKPNTRYGNHASRITERILNVPLISQLPGLPTGCEITAVTMMLHYNGSKISHISLAKAMPKHHNNPNKGYVGDPFKKSGWTIYPPALKKLITKQVGNAIIMTGKSNSALEQQLNRKKPIVIWASRMHGFSVHAITLTGYNQTHYFYNDPWSGEKNKKITKKQFNVLWGNQKKRAISI